MPPTDPTSQDIHLVVDEPGVVVNGMRYTASYEVIPFAGEGEDDQNSWERASDRVAAVLKRLQDAGTTYAGEVVGVRYDAEGRTVRVSLSPTPSDGAQEAIRAALYPAEVNFRD